MPSKIQVDQIAGASGNTVTVPSGQTLDISSATLSLPSTIVTTTGTQTLTNKTIGVSQLTGTLPVANGGTGLTTLGSANQVLRVNSGATALEFGTVSSALLQRKFFQFSDEGVNNTANAWTNLNHPVGDGTLEITPTASGNIIEIAFTFFIGHTNTWQAATSRVQFSTDGGSTYSNSVSLGNDGGYGGVLNYNTDDSVGDVHSGILWLATASANTHKFRWQYYGENGGPGFRLNYNESNNAGGTAHSTIIISEYANVSGITSGAL